MRISLVQVGLWGILLGVTLGALTLEQYAQFQAQNPEELLYDLDLPEKHNYPQLPKLIFTTPWGKAGHKLTLKYASKLQWVSPCWYSLKVGSRGNIIFENQHNFDKQWYGSMRKANPQIKIVPRVYLEGGDINVFQAIGSNKAAFTQAIVLIKRLVDEKGFDGVVWDTPYNFFESQRSDLNRLILEWVKVLREVLDQKLIFFNMANPVDNMQSLDLEVYRQLKIDYLLIQNYDKGDRYLEMVRASLSFRKQLKASYEFMLMLPFFTLSSSKGGMSSAEAAKDLLAKGVSLATLQNGICRFMTEGSRQNYLMPCLSYFKRVFGMIKGESVAVGFWEGGNGLQNFYRFL